nr:reverse transcriptase domain-containing protein [Tanacetum cinerariifolium]
MRTRSSSNLPVVSSNPSTSNPKRRNRRRLKQPFILEESPVDTMADQCTMAELLRAPTEGYAEAIMVPSILADQFELKHSLINMMTTDQFFGLEKDNPHDYIRAARWWLEKEPPCSIRTWEDLVSKFINKFFPPSRTKNLRNEISNFQQWFDESFHEAWDRYKDLLRTCPHHGFTEFHQLDTFYNALNPTNQDSLNAAAGGNLLERRTQYVLTIIENKSKIAKLTHVVNQQTSVVTTAMTAILKQFQATPPPASEKAVEKFVLLAVVLICITSVSPPVATLSQNFGKISKDMFQQPQLITIKASLSNQTNEIKNMMASLFQMNTAFTSGSGSLPGNTVPNPKGELKASPLEVQEKDEVQVHKFWKMFKQLHVNITLADALILMPNELKCKALADLGASINLMPLSVWKKLGLPELISTRMILELANRAICTPARIARDVFVPVGKFTFPTEFVIVDYETDSRVPHILGRTFLRTARTAHALIDVYGEEMILRDGDQRLTLNMRHDTSSYSNQPQKESINLINIFNNSKGGNVLPKELLDLGSTKDIHPPLHVNPLSGSTTYSSSNPLLEELAEELALITFPPKYDDDLQFDVESDIKEIEFLLHQDIDSSLKDSIDQSNLANPADNFVHSMPEMFTNEHALDYSSLLIFDEYDDDFLEVESNAENVYDDPFDSKGEKKSKNLNS